MSVIRPTMARPFLVAATVCAAAAAGCATLKAPTWPWKKDAGSTDVAGDTSDSDVISSEYQAGPRDIGWDYFRGENVNKRWKKLVGRGPNETVARKALAEADTLFRAGKYREAIPKYKQVVDRWPDSALEEDGLWQLAECLFFTDQYPKAEDRYDELVKKYANTRHLDRIAQQARQKFDTIKDLEDVSDDPFPLLTRVLNPDSLKEAELDAIAEADAVIARQDTGGAGPPLF